MKRLLLTVMAAAALGGVAMTAAATGAAAGEMAVKPVPAPIMKSVFAEVRSRDVAPARARIGGTLDALGVEEGDVVAAGEVIATVVDARLALQLDALEARLEALESQLENAETTLTRAKELIARRAIPQSRLDEAQTQVDVLRSQILAARADRAVTAEQASQGAVLAPASGRVLTVPAIKGAVILPGETVARIAGGGAYLRLSLPERHAAGIREGDLVEVGQRRLAGDGAAVTLKGRLAKIYPEIENGRVEADVEVDGLGDLFIGERALVSLPIGTRDIIAAPPEAISLRHGVDYVTLLRGDARIEAAVIPGARFETEDGPLVEILTGLRAGDVIATPDAADLPK